MLQQVIFYSPRPAFLVFFREARAPLFPCSTVFSPLAPDGRKRSPLRRLSIIAWAMKLTTLFKFPGSIFPRGFCHIQGIPRHACEVGDVLYRIPILSLWFVWCVASFSGHVTPPVVLSAESSRFMRAAIEYLALVMTICKRNLHGASGLQGKATMKLPYEEAGRRHLGSVWGS